MYVASITSSHFPRLMLAKKREKPFRFFPFGYDEETASALNANVEQAAFRRGRITVRNKYRFVRAGSIRYQTDLGRH
jgi:hypothetical protein